MQAIKSGCNDFIWIKIAIHFIAGQLFSQELVIRLVGVERVYDIVAISPGVRFFAIAFIAIRFSEAYEIKPVTGPAFAILWTFQQAVDQFFPGIRAGICFKCNHRFRSWWQSDQVEIGSTDQFASRGSWVEADFLRFQLVS